MTIIEAFKANVKEFLFVLYKTWKIWLSMSTIMFRHLIRFRRDTVYLF